MQDSFSSPDRHAQQSAVLQRSKLIGVAGIVFGTLSIPAAAMFGFVSWLTDRSVWFAVFPAFQLFAAALMIHGGMMMMRGRQTMWLVLVGLGILLLDGVAVVAAMVAVLTQST